MTMHSRSKFQMALFGAARAYDLFGSLGGAHGKFVASDRAALAGDFQAVRRDLLSAYEGRLDTSKRPQAEPKPSARATFEDD